MFGNKCNIAHSAFFGQFYNFRSIKTGNIDFTGVLVRLHDFQLIPIEALVEDGYIKRESLLNPDKHGAVNEFDNACAHMIGNSWRLSKEDEDKIIEISKKIV